MTEGGWAIGESELSLDGALSEPVAHSLELVAGGETVKIIRDGVLVARLVPADYTDDAEKAREIAGFAARELGRIARTAADSSNLITARAGGDQLQIRAVPRPRPRLVHYPQKAD